MEQWWAPYPEWYYEFFRDLDDSIGVKNIFWLHCDRFISDPEMVKLGEREYIDNLALVLARDTATQKHDANILGDMAEKMSAKDWVNMVMGMNKFPRCRDHFKMLELNCTWLEYMQRRVNARGLVSKQGNLYTVNFGR